jgi:cytohesin
VQPRTTKRHSDFRDVSGLTPIHRTALDGDAEALQAELDRGTSLELPAGPVSNDKLLSHEGATPLHFAAQGGHVELCRWLIDLCANVEARTAEGLTPLHSATWLTDAPDVVELLLARGSAPNVANGVGATPLHNAVRHRSGRSVTLLLRHGADVEAKDRQGMTPLHVAALVGHAVVCRLLVEAGATLTPVDQLRRTAADWAKDQGHTTLAAELERLHSNDA